MKKPLLFILTAVLFASCATVQQNGYIQSRTYKSKSLFAKKKKTKKPNSKSEDVTTESLAEFVTQANQINTKQTPSTNNQSPETQGITNQLTQTITTPTTKNESKSGVESTPKQLNTEKSKSTKFKRKQAKELIKQFKQSDEEQELTPKEEPVVHWAAIVGLITGILGFFVATLLFSVCAIVFSAIALSAINNNPEKYKGKGMAVAGLVCGILALLLIFAIVGVLLAA